MVWGDAHIAPDILLKCTRDGARLLKKHRVIVTNIYTKKDTRKL